MNLKVIPVYIFLILANKYIKLNEIKVSVNKPSMIKDRDTKSNTAYYTKEHRYHFYARDLHPFKQYCWIPKIL